MMIGLIAILAAAGVQAAPIAPSSRWLLESGERCMLSRDYDTRDGQVTVGLNPWPFDQSTEIVVVTRAPAPDVPRSGKVVVTLPGAAPVEAGFNSFLTAAADRRVARINVERKKLAGLEAAGTMTIAIGAEAPIAIRLSGTRAALSDLKACDDALLRGLGVDPTERDRIATPAAAIGPPGDWITQDDYPAAALRSESEGTVYFLWTIGLDGLARDCKIAVSSGNGDLDGAACRAITRSARYTPAIGKDGKPMISHNSRRVIWRLPE